MEKTVLYIDDHESNRRRGIISLKKTGITKFLAPLNTAECIDLINPRELKAAIVDLKLEAWVGKNYEDAFRFKGTNITDGLDLAKALLAENPAIKIGLFSAGNDLMERVKHAGLKNKVDVINIKVEPGQDKHFYVPGYLGILLDQHNLTAGDLVEGVAENEYRVTRPLIELKPELISINTGFADPGFQDYVDDLTDEQTEPDSTPTETALHETDETSFTVKTYLKSYQPDTRVPEKNIQLFLAKKILNPTEKGTHFWKLGAYYWIVSFGEQIAERYLQDTSLPDMVESLDEFEMKIESESYRASSLQVKGQEFLITFENYKKALGSIDKPAKYDLLCQLFVVRYVCKLFLDRGIGAEDAIDLLRPLSQDVQFQSQKLLFISLLDNLYQPVTGKNDIYEILAPFTRAGLPMVLEVFKGTVRYIDKTKAAVKLTSLSDPDRLRVDHFSHELLKAHLLEEGSVFEYTVFKTSYGGVGYHIEPI